MNEFPSYQELHYLIELTQTLNFSRAAERLGITQPSLSHAIKKLETTLGFDLFIRNKSGVALSPAGKSFLVHAKQLIELWKHAKSSTLISQQEVSGRITLGCHVSLALYILPKVLPSLMSQHPKLEIMIYHDISRKILEKVINLNIDIGIVANPVKHPDLIMHKLYEDEVKLWQAKKPKQNITAGDSIIICDPELTQSEWLLKQLKKRSLKYRKILASSSLELIGSLTAQDVGIGILPATIAMLHYESKIVPIKDTPVYHDEIYLIYRDENRHCKAVAETVGAIKILNKAK